MTSTHTPAAGPANASRERLWEVAAVTALFDEPFADLIHRAQEVHRTHFDPNRIQLSTLLNIKTGACPEDCAYCPQSARYDTGLQAEPLMAVDAIVAAAQAAQARGATRFCMGAAWRAPKAKDLSQVADAVRAVKALGLETCATLGMLDTEQAAQLKTAGLDYYNHNLDTSEAYYGEIVSTRTYQDRIDTLAAVRAQGIKVCCGGIVGMGEQRADRAALLCTLANLPAPPESVPINMLVQVPGTPLHGAAALDPFELVRTVAVARILMPRAYVRLSAGRETMSDELQALCFLAGANSVFYGEKLLTTRNAPRDADRDLFARLGLIPETETRT